MLIDRLFGPLATGCGSPRGLTMTKRTAADDLREQGFPVGDAGGGVATENQDADDLDADLEASTTEDETEDAGETTREGESATTEADETETTDWKKRFIGSQKQHLEDKRQLEALQQTLADTRQRLALLEAKGSSTASDTRQESRSETTRRLYDDVRNVEGKDDAEKTAKIYDTIEAHVEKRVQEHTQQVRQELTAQDQRRIRAQAEADMTAALQKHGLAPELLGTVNVIVDGLKANDPGWFTRTPVREHYDRLAEMVLEKVRPAMKAKTDDANREHRRAATGMVGTNARSTKQSTGKGEEVPDEGFGQQLARVKRDRIAEGQRQLSRIGR